MSAQETKAAQTCNPAESGQESNEISKIIEELIDIVYQNRVRTIYFGDDEFTVNYEKPNGKKYQYKVFNIYGPRMESKLDAKKRTVEIISERGECLTPTSYKGEAWVQGTKKDRYNVDLNDIAVLLAAVRKVIAEGSETVETW